MRFAVGGLELQAAKGVAAQLKERQGHGEVIPFPRQATAAISSLPDAWASASAWRACA